MIGGLGLFLGGQEVDLGHHGCSQIAQHFYFGIGPLAGLGVDDTEGADDVAGFDDQGKSRIRHDTEFADGGVVPDQGMTAGIGDDQGLAADDGMFADGITQRRSSAHADGVSFQSIAAFEELFLGGDERNQRDGRVERPGSEAGKAVKTFIWIG